MLWGMLEDMNELKQKVRLVSTIANKAVASTLKAVKKSFTLFNKLKVRIILMNKLKDEINNKMKTIEDL